MSSQFDNSTPVSPANLNRMIRGDGALEGLQLFSLFLTINNNSGTFQYTLFTNSQQGNWCNLSDIGAEQKTGNTNVGDGNVNRNGTGDYEITGLNSFTNFFALGVIKYTGDSNIGFSEVNANISNNKIHVYIKNGSGSPADPASGQYIRFNIFGFFN